MDVAAPPGREEPASKRIGAMSHGDPFIEQWQRMSNRRPDKNVHALVIVKGPDRVKTEVLQVGKSVRRAASRFVQPMTIPILVVVQLTVSLDFQFLHKPFEESLLPRDIDSPLVVRAIVVDEVFATCCLIKHNHASAPSRAINQGMGA